MGARLEGLEKKYIVVGVLIVIVVTTALVPLVSGSHAKAGCSTDADGNVVCDSANPPAGDVGAGPGDQQVTVSDVPAGDVSGDGVVPAGDTEAVESPGDGGDDTITIENAEVNGNVAGDFVEAPGPVDTANGGDDSITIDEESTVTGAVAGDWADGDGGNDTVTVDGTVQDGVYGDAADGNGGNDTVTVNGDVAGYVAGDRVGDDGGDDLINIGEDANIGSAVVGDWADGVGGDDTIIVDGTLENNPIGEDYVAGDGVVSDGGGDQITINGSIAGDVRGDQTSAGDGGSDTISLTVDGTIGGSIYGDWAVAGDGAGDVINVEGLVSTHVIGDAAAGDGGDDTINVTGAVLGDVRGDQTNGDGGNDEITIEGAVLGDVLGDHSDGDGGDDTITISGTVEGDIYADNGLLKGEPLNGGNDSVDIVEGATVEGIIDGGPGNDTLSFTFSDLLPADASAIQAIIDAANANPGEPGTLTYNDLTYNWQNFESFLSLISEIVVSSGGTVDLSGIDTTPGDETTGAPGSDGRLCNWPNAAVYSSEAGIYVYGIDENSQGYLIDFMTPDELSQYTAIPGANTMMSSSLASGVDIMLNDIGEYQVDVGPDGEGIQRFVTWDNLVPGAVVCGHFSVYDPAGTISAERLLK